MRFNAGWLDHEDRPHTSSFAPGRVAALDGRRVSQSRWSDTFSSPRCPACRMPLVARLTRGGPAFPCSCNPGV